MDVKGARIESFGRCLTWPRPLLPLRKRWPSPCRQPLRAVRPSAAASSLNARLSSEFSLIGHVRCASPIAGKEMNDAECRCTSTRARTGVFEPRFGSDVSDVCARMRDRMRQHAA